jgi:hypothetical protein
MAGTLDQQQTDCCTAGSTLDATQSLAQTFTAGLSGGVDRVDLYLGVPFATPTAPLSVEIRDASGGAPGGTVLAGASVPASSVPVGPGFVSIGFATPAPVAAGTQYAIVAYSSTAASPYDWWDATTADPYAGGGPFFTATSPPSGAWSPNTNDFVFKTYVVPAMTTTTTPAVTPAAPTGTPTGLRAAALKKCKHKHGHKRKKCKKRANLLPI